MKMKMKMISNLSHGRCLHQPHSRQLIMTRTKCQIHARIIITLTTRRKCTRLQGAAYIVKYTHISPKPDYAFIIINITYTLLTTSFLFFILMMMIYNSFTEAESGVLD